MKIKLGAKICPDDKRGYLGDNISGRLPAMTIVAAGSPPRTNTTSALSGSVAIPSKGRGSVLPGIAQPVVSSKVRTISVKQR